MAGDQFKYYVTDGVLRLNGFDIENQDGYCWKAPLEVVANGSLASLARALRAESHDWKRDTHVDEWGMTYVLGDFRVADVPADDFDVEYSNPEPLSIGWDPDDGVVLDIQVALDGLELGDDEYKPLLDGSLARLGSNVVTAVATGTGTQGLVTIRVTTPRRGATVGDAVTICDTVCRLVGQLTDGDFDADVALDLIVAGRADLLIGLAESNWLEAKSELHSIGDPAGEIELAQDVARFCNGERASLLVIGMTTKRVMGVDTITGLRLLDEPAQTSTIHKVIDRRVFPPVDGLEVHNAVAKTTKGRTGYVTVLRIPAQPGESKPFLVHGAIVEGKVEGAFISIVRRRGEHSVPVRAESIHAALAAGNALLRHGCGRTRQTDGPPTNLQSASASDQE
ncbi:hypothetical protein [Aeromicrobium erythreum]|uniref:Schlafen AlbA-2 domain-containing protein n=1 Tax=Aeromicrobium erythreum TaxID=2041 RepID=A0A0U4D5F4_9ACTN|nr:hypothetical protein [Aeromicrobium erythreum]ALX03442.1 hypothetical protein AERYTH_01370 [Aeromicrobium erythreum]